MAKYQKQKQARTEKHRLVRWLWKQINEQRISQEDIAEQSGVSSSAMRKWRTGTRTPRMEEFDAVAASLGYELTIQKIRNGGVSSFDAVPQILLEGSTIRIKDGDAGTLLKDTQLDVVIVGVNPRMSRAWYADQRPAGTYTDTPDCYSLDGVHPHPVSKATQNGFCATCPHNVYGSKITPTGQKIKACHGILRLALVTADDPTGPVYLLQLTSTLTLVAWGNYQRELVMRGIPPECVKTRLSLDPTASFPQLLFRFGGFLGEAATEAVDSLFGSNKVKAITGESPSKPALSLTGSASRRRPHG